MKNEYFLLLCFYCLFTKVLYAINLGDDCFSKD